MIKLGILASTRGTDMQALIDAINSRELDAQISIVISDKENAYALERAKKYGLKSLFLDPKGKSREEYDKEVSKALDDHSAELILLIGYMKLMSRWFVEKYKNKVMNIHPSLLPAFAGQINLDVYDEVFRRGCKITGASLFFIDTGADTGPIILQKAVDIDEGDTIQTLRDKVQKAEQEIILKGIKLFSEGKLEVVDGKVKIIE